MRSLVASHCWDVQELEKELRKTLETKVKKQKEKWTLCWTGSAVHFSVMWWRSWRSAFHYITETDLKRSVMADWDLTPSLWHLEPSGTDPPSHLPWLVNTKQLCSLMSASPVPGSPYIWACMESNSVMSVHLSKQRCQTFRVRVTKLWSADFPQPNRCQPSWEARPSGAVVKRAVRSHEKCLQCVFESPECKRCVKSPIVVKVSCVFSHWWEEMTNTKEGWRWG